MPQDSLEEWFLGFELAFPRKASNTAHFSKLVLRFVALPRYRWTLLPECRMPNRWGYQELGPERRPSISSARGHHPTEISEPSISSRRGATLNFGERRIPSEREWSPLLPGVAAPA